MTIPPSTLNISQDDFIAYHKTKGKKNALHIVFFGGFMSDMQGTKAVALEEFCKKEGLNFVRFDYFGHGQSSGEFTKNTISSWTQNCIDVIDNLTYGNLIIVGSSMGGWLMLLAALARPKRVSALIGIASAPDFTEDLLWNGFSDEQKKALEEQGVFDLESQFNDTPYPISMNLIKDGRKHLLLGKKKLNITCPVTLIHGKNDLDVPYIYSLKLAQKLGKKDTIINIVDDGDHRMSTPENIDLLEKTIKEMIANH